MMALGASFATAVSGIFRNKYGTKVSIAIVSVPTTVGWLLIIFGTNAEMVKLLKLNCMQKI